jgi:hypothetical protein
MACSNIRGNGTWTLLGIEGVPLATSPTEGCGIAVVACERLEREEGVGAVGLADKY